MIRFSKYKRTNSINAYSSILIPTWNNINYLKLCVESIKKNSTYPHQIIIAINEGTDGTKEWIEQQLDIDCIYSEKNTGICYALNACRSLVATDYIVYANDDMYFLPGWDIAIWDEINSLSKNQSDRSNYFMLSSTLIEPSGDNPCAVIRDFGHDIETFQENSLLREADNLHRENWRGSTWPPNIIPLACWDLVGGMSIEFSPGMYSDPDFSKKLWELGIRDFIGVGKSLVYHFSQKSTKRIKQNNGKKTFILKWGVTARTFIKFYLKRGENVSDDDKKKRPPKPGNLFQIIKRLKSCF